MAQKLQPFLLHLSYFLFQSRHPPSHTTTWSPCSLLSAAYPPPSPLLGKTSSGLPHSSIFILLLQDIMFRALPRLLSPLRSLPGSSFLQLDFLGFFLYSLSSHLTRMSHPPTPLLGPLSFFHLFLPSPLNSSPSHFPLSRWKISTQFQT